MSDLFNLISVGIKNVPNRKLLINLRKQAFNINQGFNKIAFDTRKINQETDYIPRRGLQNYHRSEKFVSDAINLKVESFKKIAKTLEELKLTYGKEPAWQNSYVRVLMAAVNKALRTDQADAEFSDTQPSIGNLNYLEELMYVRYRLTPESVSNMTEQALKTALLNKDEGLVSQGFTDYPKEITTSDISKFSYDGLMEKMLATMAQVMSSYKPPQDDDNLTSKLFDVKATKDSPEIERTVTITIKDKVIDKITELNKLADVPKADVIKEE